MRSILFRMMWLLLLIPAAGGAQEHAPVAWQEVSVSLRPELHQVSGESTIAFAAGTRKAVLRLSPGARVASVKVAGEPARYAFAGGVLSLDLPAGKGPITVSVAYEESFNDPVSRNPAAEDPSYGVNAAIGREGTFLGGGAYWYPVPEEVPAARKTTISAPAGIEGITFGARVARETVSGVTRSVWQERHPVGVLSLSAGPYRVQERQVGGLKLYSYFYPANEELAPRYLDAAARYLSLYQDLFGPYPFEKFAVVENYFPTGYGFPSFTLLGGSVIRLPFIVDTSLPHEIAHSWWGNGIDVDMGEGNWCEGLVTYLSDYLLKERRSPVEALDYRRQLLIDYASLVTPENDFPLTEFVSRNDPASRAIGYGKSAMVFHMIRTRVGDQAFFDALRDLSRSRMYGSASWSDLVAAFSRRAGRDLAPMLKPWLTRTGGPQLSLANVRSRDDGGRWTVTGTLKQASSPFQVEVPLRLESAGGSVEKVVPVPAQKATSFALSALSAPQRLILDPDVTVFRILAPGEIPATVNSVKGSTNLTGVVTRNCKAQPGTFRNFLASLSQGGARLVDESQLGQLRDGEDDLVFCGVPAERALLPAPPEGVELSGAGFTADGKTPPSGDGLLFLALQRPAPRKGVVALFQPLSEESALRYGPKITHYGKYGYLLFSEGGNKHKGTAVVTDPSVAVDLTREH